MILEIAILHVNLGKEKEFEASFKEAQMYIKKMPGYISHELKKSADSTHKYLLLVRWETLEDHQKGFRKSEEYQEWKKLLHHYYNPVPKVEYFEDQNVFEGNG